MVFAITLTNNKGGVGKTTTAVNLATGIVKVLRRNQAPNCRVLLVDTDSQGHASLLTTGQADFGPHQSLYTVMLAAPREQAQVLLECIVASAEDPDLHILPASQLIEKAQKELNGVPGAPYRLADALRHVQAHYAAVLFDTRPSFSLATEMALLASTHAVIPVEPRYLETVGLLSVISQINAIREGWRHTRLRVSGILVTKMDNRVRGHHDMLQHLTTHPELGPLHCGTIPVNEAVAYSHHNHQSIFSYDPTCPASRAYARFVEHMLRTGAAEGHLV